MKMNAPHMNLNVQFDIVVHSSYLLQVSNKLAPSTATHPRTTEFSITAPKSTLATIRTIISR